MTTGQKIRKYRRQKDWTQAQLADVMGMNMFNINRYECDRTKPRQKLIQRFADALGVKAEDLAPEIDESKKSEFRDQELFEQMKAIDLLGEPDRSALKRIIQAVIIKNQVQTLTKTA